MRSKSIAFVSKPLDVLNTVEFCYETKVTNVRYFIVGYGTNQDKCEELLRLLKFSYSRVFSPDIYYDIVPRFPISNKYVLVFFKLFVFTLGYFFWFLSVIYFYGYFFGKKYQNVILDAWRNKLFFLSFVTADRLVIIDGGASTLTWNLIGNWEKMGPIPAIFDYIKSQQFNKPRVKVNFENCQGFHNIVGYTPRIVKNLLQRKLQNLGEITLFTGYYNNIHWKSNSIIRNEFKWSNSVKREYIVSKYILIMGYPDFYRISDQINYVLTKYDGLIRDNYSIKYRVHPSVSTKEFLDFQNSVIDFNIEFVVPKYGLEFDFLIAESLPAVILTYVSSSLSWMDKMNLPSEIVIYDVYQSLQNV